MTLAEFLLARIAEDESDAQNAARQEGCADWSEEDGSDFASHVARWDPARVLAECEAKRRIVTDVHRDRNAEWRKEWIAENPEYARQYPDEAPAPQCDGCSGFGDFIVPLDECPTLRLLALPYVDHPDYREEWLTASLDP